MAGPRRATVSGPLGGYVEGFVSELVQLGYSPPSFEAQLRLLRFLSGWLAAEGLSAEELTVAVAGRFLDERRRVGRCGRSGR